MLSRLLAFFHGLLSPKPVRLAIVRRYADANGNWIGELYIKRRRGSHLEHTSYEMVGVSLDSLPLEESTYDGDNVDGGIGARIDLEHDFLYPMPRGFVRVGALSPQDNDSVREMVAGLPKRRMTLTVHNRFIEHVLERP